MYYKALTFFRIRHEDLFDALEAANIIKIQRVSPQRAQDEKMVVLMYIRVCVCVCECVCV